jgi:hypothetical protein
MSSKIYELFGYLADDRSTEATRCRRQCKCPFTGEECDGGGNRYQSFLTLDPDKDRELSAFFDGRIANIPAGVCSLVTSERVWIVCPRRLFVLDHGEEHTTHITFCEGLLRQYAPSAFARKAGVWSEVKFKYAEGRSDETADSEKTFDYTFDYIICPTHPMSLAEIAAEQGVTERKLEINLTKNGYTLARRDGRTYVEEYPDGMPLIIEVMTSSTSGGNKAKGTTIQNAFRQAILDKPQEAPGINYRQIWARMVSQLIVKSQIGKAWGGHTMWVLQDALADYISNTTDLNLKKLISQALKEVNILTLRYQQNLRQSTGTLPLEVDNLYAGRIPPIQGDTDFNKLLQAGSIPPKALFREKLLGKRPRTFILA